MKKRYYLSLVACLVMFSGVFSSAFADANYTDYYVNTETELNSALIDPAPDAKQLYINSNINLLNNLSQPTANDFSVNGNNNILDGGGKNGFIAPAAATNTIKDLTFTNFTASSVYAPVQGFNYNLGGAILNTTGTVNIYGSHFTNNVAGGYVAAGGAISNANYLNFANTGTVNIYDSSFENNKTDINALGAGGAIFNTGTVNIYNSTFIKNATSTTDSSSNGGAIANEKTLNIYGSTFGTNDIANANSSYDGGAIYNFNGATTKIYDSTFTNNHASDRGGAIYNDSTFTVYDSSFADNTAEIYGGAIYNVGTAYFIADKNEVDFKNNTAGLNGGVIYNSKNLYLIANNGGITFSGNTATSLGNDIYNNGVNSKLYLNAGLGETSFNDGIYSEGNIYINKSGITVDGLTAPTIGRVVLNSALTGSGSVEVDGGTLKTGAGGFIGASGVSIGALQFGDGTNASSTILDLANGSIGTVNVSSMTVSANNKTSIWTDVDLTSSGSKSDTINTTGAFNVNGNLNLATVRMLHDATSTATVNAPVSVFGSGNFGTLASQFRTYTNNYAYTVNLASGVLSFDRGTNTVAGLKFAVLDSVDAERSFSLIGTDYMADSTYNLSNGAVGNPLTLTVFGTRTSTNDGLAIHGNSNYQLFTVPQYAQLNIVDAVLKYAYFNGNGSAINNSGTLNIYDSLLTNNTVLDKSGGAIYNAASSICHIADSTFTNNRAGETSGSGGAIYNLGTTAIYNSTFTGNSARDGGAIYAAGGTTTISDSTFVDNLGVSGGGALYNYGNGSTVNVYNSIFGGDPTTVDTTTTNHGNTSKSGGAIYNEGGIVNVSNSMFKYNESNTNGGAIYNNAGTMTVYDSTFKNNVANGTGGAIYNSGTANISNSQFTGNSSLVSDGGGAIYNDGSDATTSIYHSTFIQNNANNYGGAIVNNGGKLIVSDSIFGGDDGIYANGAGGGGAIFSSGDTATNNIYNSIFSNNNAGHEGGAIDASGTTINIYNSIFNNNNAGYEGGAIDIATSTVNIYNSLFSENKSDFGGAISVEGYEPILRPNSIVTIYNSTFKNNSASSGGAIYVNGGIVNVISDLGNTTFTGNTATTQGGAIYAEANSAINLIANGGNILFTGNKVNDVDNDICLKTSYSDAAHGHSPIISTLNLNAKAGNNITFNGGILSDTKYNIISINKAYDSGDATTTVADVPTNGEIVFNAKVDTSTMNLYGGTLTLGKDNYLNHNNLTILSNDVGATASTVGGTLNLATGTIGTMNLNTLTLTNSANLKIDADLSTGKADTISADTISGNGKLNINYINVLGNKTGITTTKITDSSAMYDKITLGVNKVLTPIYQYGVTYDQAGNLVFSGPGGGGGGFNPSILTGPVSANVGAYMSQIATYNEALGRAELFMSLPKNERLLMRQRNMYANVGGSDVQPEVFSPTFLPDEKGGLWFKQYTSFENVPMNNGPNVSNVGYGALIGADSPMYHLRNGYDGYVTAYVGYNGSHQNYDNVGANQNGGALGLTGTLYKGNFFTALTASVGDSYGQANTMYGVDNFNTLLAGLAWKSGYNIEMAQGKFILQPSLLAAYTFANTFDYTTASGVNISSDPMNAVQIAPGLKLIANMENGWQPYLAANMVFNIMDTQKFRANDVQLPQMSIAPYFEYGIGVQRRWGERFTGFGQTMLRGGGRNGIALQFGFRIAIGK